MGSFVSRCVNCVPLAPALALERAELPLHIYSPAHFQPAVMITKTGTTLHISKTTITAPQHSLIPWEGGPGLAWTVTFTDNVGPVQFSNTDNVPALVIGAPGTAIQFEVTSPGCTAIRGELRIT